MNILMKIPIGYRLLMPGSRVTEEDHYIRKGKETLNLSDWVGCCGLWEKFPNDKFSFTEEKWTVITSRPIGKNENRILAIQEEFNKANNELQIISDAQKRLKKIHAKLARIVKKNNLT